MKFTLSLLAVLALGQQLFAQNYINTTSGNVSIGAGSTQPAYPLTIQSTNTTLGYFKNTTSSNTSISVLNSTGQLNLGIGASTPYAYAWSNTGSFFVGNDGSPVLMVKGMSNGAVGINTTNPGWPLDVNGVIHSSSEVWVDQINPGNAGVWVRGSANNPSSVVLQGGAGNWQDWWITGDNGLFRIGGNGGAGPYPGVLVIDYNGNSAFGGTPTSNYKLNVFGNLRANQVVVNTTGADYVFDTTYRLPSLQEVDRYIHTHHHLQDVPSAGQMQEQGMSLGENQTVLLKKIEELTLYIVEQDKKVAKMQTEIDELKASH